MLRKFLFIVIGLLLMVSAHAQHVLYGDEAANKFKGSSQIYINNTSGMPAYVKLASPFNDQPDNYVNTLVQQLNLGNGVKFVKYREETDDIGMVHYRYQQYYNSIPIDGSTLILHSKNGKIESFNGEYFKVTLNNLLEPLEADFCLRRNLDSSVFYAWEDEHEQKLHSLSHQDDKADAYPRGELVLYPLNTSAQTIELLLCWKFDIHSITPMDIYFLFVNANTGEIVNKEKTLCEIDVNGKAKTKYAGTQTIRVDSLGPNSFRMRETGRGGGIDTYDNANGTDFTDNNNIWDSTASYRQQVAGDIHFGMEKTFDYYKSYHNRNGYNNSNGKVIAILQGNYVNAFWGGNSAAFGMGSGTWGPVTGIDVVAHEYTHGVTQTSSNLVYSQEPGALNESFSDIFGKLVEYYALKSKFSWYLGRYGANNGKGFRNMANPNEILSPDTYGGKYWNSGDIVHYNSGVQNFWFYLLSEGGSGKNDSNHTYYVDSIGMEKAGKVAYRNNTYYLTKTSKFVDARFYAIKSAIDIFGECSKEVEAVTNAWYAVGVGKGYTSPVGKPNGTKIEPYNPKYCNTDSVMTIDFKNPYTYSGINYLWNFGDGKSSTIQTPKHQFTGYGKYKVILRTEYCYKYYYDTSIIGISQTPVVDFSVNTTKQCKDKNDFVFTSNSYSKLKRKLNYSWSSNPLFVSGKDSVARFKFDTESLYDIYLVVEDDLGCKTQIIKRIEVIASPKFDFNFKNSCPQLNVNFTAINLPDTINYPYKIQWDLSDGIAATTPVAGRTFDKPGLYKIILSNSSSISTCNDSVIKYITIFNAPVSDFYWDSLCEGVESTFRRKITNDTISYFEWNFGIYRPSDRDSIKHSFPKAGSYPVSIKTVGKKCINTTTKMVYVGSSPVALFSGHDVCEEESQVFKNTSYGVGQPLDESFWEFGDATISTDPEPDKTYYMCGNQQVKLTVSDLRGCKNSSTLNIKVNPKPLAELTANDVCFGQNLQLMSKSSINDGSPIDTKWFLNNTLKGSTTDIIIPNVPAGNHNVRLELKSDKGCETIIQKSVRVKDLPNASFSGLSPIYCLNENPVPKAFISGGEWFINGNSMPANYMFSQTGNYLLMYRLTKVGCKDSTTQAVSVIELPTLNLGNDERFCEPKEIVLNARVSNTSSYLWNTGETSESIKVNKTGNYHVIADHRCGKLKDTVLLTFFGEECSWFVPNAFSPNNDGINDVFEIKGRVFAEMEISVYNRLFQIVYHYVGPYKPWDGTMSNGEPIGLGVYPCRLILKGFNGEVKEEMTTITVVK